MTTTLRPVSSIPNNSTRRELQFQKKITKNKLRELLSSGKDTILNTFPLNYEILHFEHRYLMKLVVVLKREEHCTIFPILCGFFSFDKYLIIRRTYLLFPPRKIKWEYKMKGSNSGLQWIRCDVFQYYKESNKNL